MSYCVNCGVKLKASEKICPLCNTKVINPNIDIEKTYKPVYSNKIENRKHINYKYLIKLILISLFLFSLLIIGIDYLVNNSISYSLYILLSTFYLTGIFQYIFRKNIYLSHLINAISSLLFSFLLCLLLNNINVFKYILVPILVSIWLYVFLITSVIKNTKANLFLKISIISVYLCVILISIESGIDYYINKSISLSYSLISSLPILLISLIIFIISLNKKLYNKIKASLFI